MIALGRPASVERPRDWGPTATARGIDHRGWEASSSRRTLRGSHRPCSRISYAISLEANPAVARTGTHRVAPVEEHDPPTASLLTLHGRCLLRRVADGAPACGVRASIPVPASSEARKGTPCRESSRSTRGGGVNSRQSPSRAGRVQARGRPTEAEF
jgi:hypothetical protein